MKITQILKDSSDIYHIIKNPNFTESLFGVNPTTERYRTKNEVFNYFPHIKIFYNSKGEIMPFNSKECIALNNFERRF